MTLWQNIIHIFMLVKLFFYNNAISVIFIYGSVLLMSMHF